MVYRISKSRKIRTGRGSTVFAGVSTRSQLRNLNISIKNIELKRRQDIIQRGETRRLKLMNQTKSMHDNLQKTATWARNNPPYKVVYNVPADIIKSISREWLRIGKPILDKDTFEMAITRKELKSQILPQKMVDDLGKDILDESLDYLGGKAIKSIWKGGRKSYSTIKALRKARKNSYNK